MELFSTLFGFAGITTTVIIYQSKKRYQLLLWKLISDVLWFLHYFLIGAYSGAAISLIGLTRELVFINRQKKWASHPGWLVLFLLLSVGSAVVTWKSAFSLLPMTASILAVIGFWIGKPALSRLLSFPISGCMLTYDFTLSPISLAGIVNEVLTVSSSIIGMIRYDRRS